MATVVQRSFSGGEISPSMYGRTDIAKYQTGLRTCRNNIVLRQGGVSNRPGTTLVGETKFSDKTCRLFTFFLDPSTTFGLEFGDHYMRVIRQGEYIMAGAVPYELVMPYTALEVATLDIGRAQKANVSTLCQHGHYPQELTYIAPDNWTIADMHTGPTILPPTGVVITGDPNTGTFDGTILVCPNPIYVGGHIFATLNGVPIGLTPLPFSGAVLDVPNSTQFTYSGTIQPDGTYAGTFNGHINIFTTIDFVSGTFIGARTLAPASEIAITSIDATTGEESTPVIVQTPRGTGGNPITLTWTAAVGAGKYKVYAYIPKSIPKAYGLIDEVLNVVTVTDTGAVPSAIVLSPTFKDPFAGVGNYPAVSAVYQQRRYFANTVNNPEHIYGSQIGRMSNFNISAPLRADDAVDFGVVGRQTNRIMHLLDLRALFIFTDTGEYAIQGGIITPDNVDLKQQAYNGSSTLNPVVVGNLPVFVQRAGSIARNILYDFYSQSFTSNDQSIFSTHLFEGHSLVELAYAKIPNSVVWAVRDDGVLLGFTYVPEHEVAGWHRHDTDGRFESVCTVSEDSGLGFHTEDILYAVVKRTVNGVAKRFVERMETRFITDIKDAVFMDCSSKYDGRGTTLAPGAGNTFQLQTLTGGWTPNDTLLLSAYWPAGFTAAIVGQAIFFTAADGRTIKCKVTVFVDPTILQVMPLMDVPADLQNAFVESSAWAIAHNYVDGLASLEGKAVSVLGDGNVVASPNNTVNYQTPIVVVGGVATLPAWYTVISVGLPYLSDFETLDMDSLQGETLMGKKKVVERIAMQLEKTRGLWIGGKVPVLPEITKGLTEPKLRKHEDWDVPTEMLTGVLENSIGSTWNNNGRVFIRQTDPIPATILSIAPTGFIPLQG